MKIMKRIGALFGRKPTASNRVHLLHWAKIEYKKDWEYAYHYMVTHDGNPPRYIRDVTIR